MTRLDPRDEQFAELRRLVEQLRAEVEALRAENAQLRAENAQLRAENAELKGRLGQNSLNSSLPPSRDNQEAREKRRAKAAKAAKRREKEARSKNRSSKRILVPPERVTSSEDHHPTECGGCGRALSAKDLVAEPERIQHFELPQIRPLVHEIRVHSAACPCCGHVTKARSPESARKPSLGPDLRAFMALMVGRFQLSRRDVVELLDDVFHIPVSLRLVSKTEANTSDELEPAYVEAHDFVRNSSVVHADETSWSYGGIPGWMWVATTGHVAIFAIDNRRSREVAKRLLGKFAGVVVSDRFVAYDGFERRQACWAHLERSAQELVDHGEAAATAVGQKLLDFIHEMFSLWHRFQDEKLTRRGLQTQVKGQGRKLLRSLAANAADLPTKARRLVQGLEKARDHLFTFTEVEGVEPTNNLAERDIRRGVMWRKKSQATRTERGRRFVERLMTVVISCRAQQRSSFEFLRDTLRPDVPNPSLIPMGVP